MRKVSIISLLSILIIILLLSSCSLLIDGYLRRFANNSICWDDEEHILIYTNITAYDDYTTIGGESRDFIWLGGEIWRINVNTGEKELLMRKKELAYYQELWDVRIVKNNDNYYLSGTFNTYKIKEDFSGWDEFGDYTYPVFSSNGQYVVAVARIYDIERYNLESGEEELLFQADEYVTSLDYDFDRSLLLLDNIRLVDLNTGTDTVLLYHGEEISGYSIYSPHYARYGMFLENEIIIDIESGNNDIYSKVYIDTDSISNKILRYGLRGVPNSDGTRFAFGVDNGVEIQDGNGTVITKVIFDSSGL